MPLCRVLDLEARAMCRIHKGASGGLNGQHAFHCTLDLGQGAFAGFIRYRPIFAQCEFGLLDGGDFPCVAVFSDD